MSETYYIEAIMAETQLTLRVLPIVDLEVTGVEFTGVKMQGIVQEVKVSVKNNGSEYNGNLYLRINDEYVAGEGVALRAGETTDVFFNYYPNDSGDNSYKICLSSDGSQPLNNGTGNVEMAAYNATSDINLEKTLIINNQTDGDYIFGDIMDITLIAKNNSDRVYKGWIKLSTEDNYFDSKSPIVIAPGDSVVLNYAEGLTIGETYTVYPYQIIQNGTSYHKSHEGGHVTYTAAEGLEVTLADGTSDMVVAEPTYVPTPSTTAVDLRGVTTVNSVDTEFADPNCLFVIDEDADIEGLGLENTNVIKGTSAENIQLTDESIGFTAPINFTAKEISYKRTFTQGTDGTGSGWTTIILPFDVQKVMVGENEIDWFHDSDETGKQFWLRELKSDDEGSVTFGYVSELKANTPYIIAVPGNKWGTEWNLIGKTLKFIGKSNANIEKDAETEKDGDHYSFVGTTVRQQLEDVYALNEEGSTFEYGNAMIAPFRAYFTPLGGSNPSRLIIRSEDGKTTAIGQLPAEIATPDGIYTLDGRKVKGNLKKGVYIVNGKKMIK